MNSAAPSLMSLALLGEDFSETDALGPLASLPGLQGPSSFHLQSEAHFPGQIPDRLPEMPELCLLA